MEKPIVFTKQAIFEQTIFWKNNFIKQSEKQKKWQSEKKIFKFLLNDWKNKFLVITDYQVWFTFLNSFLQVIIFQNAFSQNDN